MDAVLASALYQSPTLLQNAAGSEGQPKPVGPNVARAASTSLRSLTQTRSMICTCLTAWKKPQANSRSSMELAAATRSRLRSVHEREHGRVCGFSPYCGFRSGQGRESVSWYLAHPELIIDAKFILC